MLPKVSIVIPVYNGTDYLHEAVKSALEQTYPNKEIIVVNDGSSDGGATEQIALSFGDKIRYYSKKNGGVASALNLAVKMMSGEFLSWLSHDDLYYPDKVASQIHLLSEMPNAARTIIYGDYAVFFGDAVQDLKEMRLPDTPPEQFRYFITTRNVVHGCTLLIPKSAFDECGGFDEALRTTQDYDLWFRMAEKYSFVHVPKLFVKARAHAEQGSVKMKDTALKEINELLAKFVTNLTEQELSSQKKRSLGLVYAGISDNFRLRGFIDAANAAESLAWQRLRQGSWSEALGVIVKTIKTRAVSTPLGWARRFFSILKFRVKQCLK